MAAIADELGVVDEGTEAARIALIKLLAHQCIQPLPGDNSTGGLPGEDETVGALVGKVLVDRVGLFTIEFPDDPLVLLAILLPGFFCGFKGDLRVLIDEDREVRGQSIEPSHLLDVGSHKANAFVERREVLPVDAGPDVVGESKQTLSHSPQIFKDRASTVRWREILGGAHSSSSWGMATIRDKLGRCLHEFFTEVT